MRSFSWIVSSGYARFFSTFIVAQSTIVEILFLKPRNRDSRVFVHFPRFFPVGRVHNFADRIRVPHEVLHVRTPKLGPFGRGKSTFGAEMLRLHLKALRGFFVLILRVTPAKKAFFAGFVEVHLGPRELVIVQQMLELLFEFAERV